MNNPKSQLDTYLKTLINNLLYLKSLDEQLKTIKSWETPNRVNALNIGGYFIRLVTYSFYRTILIELYKLFAENEDRTLIDYLNKLKSNIDSVSPTKYDIQAGENIKIKSSVYIGIINRQLKSIESKKEILKRIKALRDKTTHADKDYFNNRTAVYKKYPVNNSDVDDLINLASRILKFHYSHIFNASLEMKIHSSNDISSLLIYTRAYDRIWHDKNLNIKKYIYKLDKYPP